jgi:hypothetical protein
MARLTLKRNLPGEGLKVQNMMISNQRRACFILHLLNIQRNVFASSVFAEDIYANLTLRLPA